MKKLSAVMLIAALCLSMVMMTACGGNTEVNDESLQKVLDKGQFVLGLDDSFPPMGYRDENNEIVGFDIDVAKEVATRMGVELVIQPIIWDEMMMELDTYKVDCIWNGMSINEERQKAMNLTEPYMKNRMVFVTKSNSGINSLADMMGKKVAVQNGSTAQEILEESETAKLVDEILSFKDNVTAFMDLDSSGVDSVFLDEVVANDFITRNQKDYQVINEALADEDYAIGFRKGDQALRDKVQSILSEMKNDGTLAKISEKWFGKDVTTVK